MVRQPWLSHLRNFALIGILSAITFLALYPLRDGPKYLGFHTDKIIRAYINGGYEYSAIRSYTTTHPEVFVTDMAGAGRPLFVWIVAGLHRVTGLDPNRIYPILNYSAFTGAAMLLYVIGIEGFALSLPAAVFSALWFLMMSPVGVIYETQAHPDGIGMLLMSAGVLAFAKKRYALSAVFLAVSILAKESGYFLLLYFGLRLVLSPDAPERRGTASILTTRAARAPWSLRSAFC